MSTSTQQGHQHRAAAAPAGQPVRITAQQLGRQHLGCRCRIPFLDEEFRLNAMHLQADRVYVFASMADNSGYELPLTTLVEVRP